MNTLTERDPLSERNATLTLTTSAADAEPRPPAVAASVAVTPFDRTRALMRRVAANVMLHTSRRVQFLGRVGVVGLALMIFAMAFFITTNSALRTHGYELRADLLKAQQSAAARRAAGQDASPTATLETLLRKLPKRSELPAITEQIVSQAAGAGLTLERGSYDFTVMHSGRIVRARMSFPVQGAYPNVRKFVDATLTTLPNTAVDGLRLERESVGANEIKADIRFAVFLRNEP